MYEMVLKIRDLPDKGVNISLECFQLSPETLTPEKTIDLEAADALGLKDKPGAAAAMFAIMSFLNEKVDILKNKQT